MKFIAKAYASVDVAEVEKMILEFYGIHVDLVALENMMFWADQWFVDVQPEPMPEYAKQDIEFFKKHDFFDEMTIWEFLQDMVYRAELPQGDIWLECNL